MQPYRKDSGLCVCACVCVSQRGDGERARDREEGLKRAPEAVGRVRERLLF